MPRRVEYFDDPSAPKPNSLVVAVSVVVTNAEGSILLQRRVDNELWGLPGGGMELGESVGQAVIRETKEETGLEVEPIGLVGIYSDPNHVIAYADGEVRQEFSICFKARVVGGEASVADKESKEVRFVAIDSLDKLAMHRSTRLRIQHFLEQRIEPYFV
jgi:ADP-ribose pyrophosphatase YjhB (NUDIX family)